MPWGPPGVPPGVSHVVARGAMGCPLPGCPEGSLGVSPGVCPRVSPGVPRGAPRSAPRGVLRVVPGERGDYYIGRIT